MAGSGNHIIVSAHPQGKFMEGIVYGTPKPGTLMQIKAGVEMVTGRHTWEPAAPGGDGKRTMVVVLLPDELQGKTKDDAYASGDRCFLYAPIAGEEINVRKADVAGTGDDIAIGDQLMIQNSTPGKVIKATGTIESAPFVALETITDPTSEVLVHSYATGQ